MEKENFVVWDLEKHPTKDNETSRINGSLTVVWRDWDEIIKNYPRMVYVSSVNAGEIKGPHLHTKRNSYFTCIHGKVIFVIYQDGKYTEVVCDAENPKLIFIPKNIPSAHINNSKEVARVLTLADIAWKPNDNEMQNITFNDYDWEKWK